MYSPDAIKEVELWEFSEDTKIAVLERDNYRCVACGKGKEDGVELVVDHIIPKSKGGTNDISNGQTLCTQCNLLKKNYSQTEFGKKYFIKIYRKALKANDIKMIRFCECVFNCYDKHGINGHIERPNNK